MQFALHDPQASYGLLIGIYPKRIKIFENLTQTGTYLMLSSGMMTQLRTKIQAILSLFKTDELTFRECTVTTTRVKGIPMAKAQTLKETSYHSGKLYSKKDTFGGDAV